MRAYPFSASNTPSTLLAYYNNVDTISPAFLPAVRISGRASGPQFSNMLESEESNEVESVSWTHKE